MRELVINHVPGEECRVAVVEDSRLEEFHAERADAASHVGNIYLGRVSNVEPAIQAAFIDFGLEHNGFLHVSDLHPRYFPGEGDQTTELVGKKTPRRDRPPIQECLRRGQQVLVQVIKEGVGTKGPTVTSYLSIPGRYLVMMPQMDRVGVSRKVEDEDMRKKMRQILDALDLPDGFGFILRTAGFDRTKADLKRDLSYLQRLWRDMEKRMRSGRAPALLYAESDLLVRSLRDLGGTDIDRIVIDNPGALKRAGRFLKIVAPRSAASLVGYNGAKPLFHALGLEEQISMMHSREVPLPSGGRLVIDETEALVAIDVNSGKSRDSKDAETNAFKTNMEAADEICRQIRLRDIGGILVNDLIDMRAAKHRKAIEGRFRDNLKRDRARTTILPISGFGILQMTRQRMRGSHESQHFSACPTCRGRGLVQRPDSVAADAIRELSSLVDTARIARVEMVVSPRIAGELLSAKRKTLTRIERTSGKVVEVRVSEAIPVDRVAFYAYDERGADVDLERLPHPRAPKSDFTPFQVPKADEENWAAEDAEEQHVHEPEPEELEDDGDLPDFVAEDEAAMEGGGDGSGKKKRRRRRRRGGRGRARSDGADDQGADRDADDAHDQSRDHDDEDDASAGRADSDDDDRDEEQGSGKKKKRRRRRRRGGRGRSGAEQGADGDQQASGADDTDRRNHDDDDGEAQGPSGDDTDASHDGAGDDDAQGAPKKKRRRRRSKKSAGARARDADDSGDGAGSSDDGPDREASGDDDGRPGAGADAGDVGDADGDGPPKKKKRSRRGRGGKAKATSEAKPEGAVEASDAPAPKPRSGSRRGAGSKNAPKNAPKGEAKDASKGEADSNGAAPAKPPRTLYSARRKLSASERARLASEE